MSLASVCGDHRWRPAHPRAHGRDPRRHRTQDRSRPRSRLHRVRHRRVAPGWTAGVRRLGRAECRLVTILGRVTAPGSSTTIGLVAGVAQLAERQPSNSPVVERCALNSGPPHESADSGSVWRSGPQRLTALRMVRVGRSPRRRPQHCPHPSEPEAASTSSRAGCARSLSPSHGRRDQGHDATRVVESVSRLAPRGSQLRAGPVRQCARG
jgi:hypothetical protein